ncbi:alpha-amylase family glycosyl hydrolase [Siminovitchia sediminis]|uniref:Alpha-amylase family glycosyl hydrolase n=1 Tax=Siminovitchia sediminis TaxID=1274353 RepID=A0ABW4KFB2_9BACI
MKKNLVFLLIPFLLFSSAFSAGADKKEGRTWEDEIIYSLMIDRFNNGDNQNDEGVDLTDPSHAFQGGDFRGIERKLDYLKDMGFTTIMLSPVFQNDEMGYHGERVIDFYQTDPHFGTIEDLQSLVEEAHSKDMKVMFEFVTTHIGPKHPWTSDPSKEHWLKEAEDQEIEWLEGLPLLDLENEEVQDYLIEAALWWMDETNVDGFSLSGIEQAPLEFWEKFSAAVKEKNSSFYLSGTVMDGKNADLSKYQEAGIDGVVDTPLSMEARDAYSNIDVSAGALLDRWEKNVDLYPNPQSLALQFDSKYSVRYTKDMVENNQYPIARWKSALFYLYTQPEVPIVFYGTEIALNGDMPPDNVPLMNFRTDEEFLEFIGKVGTLRQEEKTLRHGSMELLHEKDGMLVFKREYEGDTIVVAINNTTQDQTVSVPVSKLEEGKELRGMFASDLVKSSNGEYNIVVDREMMEVYKLADQTGFNLPFIFSIPLVFVVFGIFMYLAWKRGKKRNPYE